MHSDDTDLQSLVNNKINTEERLKKSAFKKRLWYGNHSIHKIPAIHYRDHSLFKPVLIANLEAQKSEKLLTDYSEVSKSLYLHRAMNEKVDQYSHQLSCYFASVSELELDAVRMDLAATLIQKHVKGYLARIKHSDKLISIQKKIHIKTRKELIETSQYCMYYVGKNSELAVKMLQKAVRYFLLKRKLKRFQSFYEGVLAKREANKLSKLISLSFVYFSRFKVNHMRFLRTRERRLKKIRRKLAILTIKKVILRENIQMKNMKVNIKKYKRQITMGIGGKMLKGDESGEDHDSHQSEIERLAKMKKMIEIEDAKRERIKLGKISYKVPKLHYIKVLPRLKHNKSSSSESSDSSEKARVPAKPPAFTPEPVKINKLKKFEHTKGNYMSPTLSFSLALKGPEWLSESNPEPRPKKPQRFPNTIAAPTKFSLQKVKMKKYIEKPSKPSWNSNPLVNECYTPSVFSTNQSYFSPPVTSDYKRPKIDTRIYNKTQDPTRISVFQKRKEIFIERVPISYKFEEALPELAKISLAYSPPRRERVEKHEKVYCKAQSPMNYFIDYNI